MKCLQSSEGPRLASTILPSGELLIKGKGRRKTLSKNQRLKYFASYVLSLGSYASAKGQSIKKEESNVADG